MTCLNCECRQVWKEYFGGTEYLFHCSISRCELKNLSRFAWRYCLMGCGNYPGVLRNWRGIHRVFLNLYASLHFPDRTDNLHVPDIAL